MINFKQRAEQLNDYIIEQRRWFHKYPELPFYEAETTKKIAKELSLMGIEVTTFSDYYGLIGHIRGKKGGKKVMLRADIDALPMDEHSGEEFSSQNPGVMHSCGHDCHAAMLLGAAKMLAECKEELEGDVELLFQSAEESCYGAKYYVEKGYLDNVDAVFGLHVWGTMDAPYINIESGYRMASCDNFKITVNGKSAHGSAPHLGNDAVLAAASIVMNLQTFVSRNNDPLNPLVATIGTFKGGTQFNIITDFVEMEGTVRTYSREIRAEIEKGMRRIIEHTAEALGCEAILDYNHIEEPVVNEHESLNNIAQNAAIKLYGAESLVSIPKSTGSEDFSFLMDKVPGVFGFIGCRNPQWGETYPNHSDKFMVDESILQRGAAIYAQFAFDFLLENAKEGGFSK